MTQSTGTLPTFGTSRSKAFIAIICDMVRCRSRASPPKRVAGLSLLYSGGNPWFDDSTWRKCGKGAPPFPHFLFPLSDLTYCACAEVCCPVLHSPRRKHEASAHHVKRGPLHGTRRVGVQGGRACCHRQRTRLCPLSRTAFACTEHVFGPVEAGQGDASGARCGVAKIMRRVPPDMRQNSRCERWPP